jgi:hypothetical protein
MLHRQGRRGSRSTRAQSSTPGSSSGRLARAVGLFVAVLALALPASALASSSAGFTSVNENIDGTGHCLNGNPLVNCNAYDGKQFVWMNGGPIGAATGNGDYFFAVLSPGGQADPNDGSPNLLSTDAYTDRTFTVSSGVVSYSGPHNVDSNKIRLADYADTSNGGGVYIMAVCSLANGYPVAPSSCKYDAFKVQSADCTTACGGGIASGPTVTKDAAGAYDNKFAWTIGKSADKTLVKQIGGSVTFTYTVTATHDGGTISGVKVTGTISVFNANVDASNNTVPVDIDGVTDQLSDSTVCTVTGGGAQTLTLAKTDFAYTCNLTALPQGQLDNTASVSWSGQALGNGDLLAGGASDFTFTDIGFTANPIDECVNVTDSYPAAGTVLGTACVGDSNPKLFTYQRTIAVPANGCQSYGNTATFTTNDTAATGSSSATVTVCGPAKTGALTIGFWKNTNGNSLISSYCAPGGKPSLATYLSGLGAGSGPFSDAAGKSCSQLVTYVNGVISGANSTNMNVMLRAQMLATALDVYFSDPALGYSTTASGKIKPPSAFLTGGPLGGFNMDLTAICPMVDNSTAGTATCTAGKPSTNGFTSGAFPAVAMTVQAILNYEATSPPYAGPPASSNWYAGNRTKEEIAKNVFDQINNQDAFAA